ncbi:MAG: hypothetical protein GY909_09440 [Oligoflexia bacterium]|nr:hypothetical protein [Oligoflexia bacterium]
MKSLLFSLFITILTFNTVGKTVYKTEWKSILFNDQFYIENIKNADLRFPMQGLNMNPKFEGKVVKKTDRISLIIYVSGEAGTSEIIRETRAIVFDKKEGKFLGDFPYKYFSKSKNPNKKKFPQPKWVVRSDMVSIIDKQTGLNKTIPLKN